MPGSSAAFALGVLVKFALRVRMGPISLSEWPSAGRTDFWLRRPSGRRFPGVYGEPVSLLPKEAQSDAAYKQMPGGYQCR